MIALARTRIAATAVVGLVLGLAAACATNGAPLGSDCLRNDDCMEGVCVALRCRLAPTDPNARNAGGVNAYSPPPLDAGAPDASDVIDAAADDASSPSADDAATSVSADASATSDAGQ